jgi:hypothetical protein
VPHDDVTLESDVITFRIAARVPGMVCEPVVAESSLRGIVCSQTREPFFDRSVLQSIVLVEEEFHIDAALKQKDPTNMTFDREYLPLVP